MTSLSTIDLIVVIVYAIGIFGLAQWVSREKAGHAKDTSDYFLASKSLPWWAIGASLIAANISAEQIVGMAGSGYKIGLAIASYEWMAALTLLIVGKFFLPIFLKNHIYTMPQFLERRYGKVLPVIMAIFWLALYVFVNLTSIIWLGSIAVNKVAGINQDPGHLAPADPHRAVRGAAAERLGPGTVVPHIGEVHRAGGQADQPGGRVSLDAAADLVAVEQGDVEVEQDEIGRLAGDARQGFRAVAGERDAVALRDQVVGQEPRNDPVVVHH